MGLATGILSGKELHRRDAEDAEKSYWPQMDRDGRGSKVAARRPGRRRLFKAVPVSLPRQIDLDLLLYDNQVISSADMVIPHPRMHERRFVLEPLSQIAENLTHPTLGATIGELLSRLA